jgi:SAM-dependent methyltransferase
MNKFSVAGAEAYERGIGRWSRRLAPVFLDFCGPTSGRLLDIGCGTGILAQFLLARGSVTGVVGIDINEPLLARARAEITDSRASFHLADAATLPHASGSFDHALSMLVWNFLEDRPASLREAMRVTRPGGTVSAAIWDMRGGFMYARFAWDIAAVLDPAAAAERDKLFRTSFLRPGSLECLWMEIGFVEVRGRSLAIDMTFSDFDDYWQPLLATGQTFSKYFGTLSAAAQSRTYEAVRAAYLVGDDDGPRSFATRAFAVTGCVPGYR